MPSSEKVETQLRKGFRVSRSREEMGESGEEELEGEKLDKQGREAKRR